MTRSIAKIHATESRALNRKNMLAAGLPALIVESVLNIVAAHGSGPLPRPALRAQRFIDHWNDHADDESVAKAWKAIAESSDDVVSLFMMMPDELTDQPLGVIFGKCAASPYEKKIGYQKLREQVEGVLELVCPPRSKLLDEIKKQNKPDEPSEFDEQWLDAMGLISPPSRRFRELLSDLSITAEGRAAAGAIRNAFGPEVQRSLKSFAKALKLVDPTAKYTAVTKQWKGARRKETIYTWRVAYLDRYLKKHKWVALATIANVNVTGLRVAGSALRMCAGKEANKTR